MSGIIIWKYEPGNYFSGIDIIDKLKINRLPLDAFPVIDLVTEDTTTIGLYQPSEFDVNIAIDTGEVSATLGLSIYDFFKSAGVNYKFIVAAEIGEPPSSVVYWGRSTPDKISFDYLTRRVAIQCKGIGEEIKDHLTGKTVGSLPANSRTEVVTFFTSIMISGIADHLYCTTSFYDYSVLIGHPGHAISNSLWNAGAWVNTLSVWDQMIELLLGLGLNYKIYSTGFPVISDNYPEFYINIFPFSDLTASGITPQIIGARDISLFKPKTNLFIKYRNQGPYAGLGYNIDILDGIISDGGNTYSTDTLIRSLNNPGPSFWYINSTLGNPGASVHDLMYRGSIYVIYRPDEANWLELPLYNNRYVLPIPPYHSPFGIDAGIAISRTINDGISPYGEPFGSSLEVYNYAIKQYSRYIPSLQSAKQLKVIYDSNNLYELWQKITLTEGTRSIDYYAARIENIDMANHTCELLLIKI